MNRLQFFLLRLSVIDFLRVINHVLAILEMTLDEVSEIIQFSSPVVLLDAFAILEKNQRRIPLYLQMILNELGLLKYHSWLYEARIEGFFPAQSVEAVSNTDTV